VIGGDSVGVVEQVGEWDGETGKGRPRDGIKLPEERGPGCKVLPSPGATGGKPPVKREDHILTRNPPHHCKTVPHLNNPNDCHEFSVSCYRRQPLLKADNRYK
jgi:hypothetical protein